MRLLPSLECDLYSGRTPEEIRIILGAVTVMQEKKLLRLFGPTGGEFAGSVSDSGFELMPVLWYNNSFNPVIRGWIEPYIEGTKIHVEMRMHKFVTGFSVFWFGGVAFFFLCGVIGFLFGKDPAMLLMILFPAVMFAFGQLTMRFGFYRPARQSIKRIMELTGGREV